MGDREGNTPVWEVVSEEPKLCPRNTRECEQVERAAEAVLLVLLAGPGMELGEHGLLGYEGRRIDVDPEFVVATAYTLALELMRTGRDMRDDVLAEAE